MEIVPVEKILLFECPHCDEIVMVNESELNCRIFRHGVFKSNFQQIPPHEAKIFCDKYVIEGLVYGCAKPFRIITNQNNEYQIEICDYI